MLMNRRALSSLALSLLALALPACSGIGVTSDHAPGIDFAALETYAWKAPAPAEAPAGAASEDDLVRARIQRAVDRELAAKGLRAVPAAEASLLVLQHLRVAERYQINDPYYAYESVEEYEEGTLIIDLVDARTQKLVWRGTGESRLRPENTPAQREERIDSVVAAILAQYPPPVK